MEKGICPGIKDGVVCGKEFEKVKPWKKYCSLQCGRREWVRTYRKKRSPAVINALIEKKLQERIDQLRGGL